MMFFFDDVVIFSSMAQSVKGKYFQELALKLDRVLVEGGDDAVVKIAVALQEKATEADRLYKRGNLTYIDHTFDDVTGHGQIEAYPVSESRNDSKRPYFRIYYRTVAAAAPVDEVLAMVKGGEE